MVEQHHLNRVVEDTPSHSDQNPEENTSELPTNHTLRTQQSPPASPRFEKRLRSGSNLSRVDVDFFDPTGVQELRRTLTQRSIQDHAAPPTLPKDISDASSQMTIVDDDKPFDFEKTMRRIVKKNDDANIKHRELGVVFRNLSVLGIGATDSYQETLGSMLNPKNILQSIQAARHPHVREILSDFEGVVRPGEMILVLGRPGSGCSTLLKTLANHRKEFHAVQGEVHYDSISPEELSNHYRGDVQYCPEDDVHFPTLTVEQTLRFAATTRTPHVRAGDTRKEFTDLVSDLLITVFGLKHARDTVVGDAAIRGVSGGEKKRVSIAEALAARSCINVWDNSTRGLDASTALEFVRALRIATDLFRTTTIVSIYQAGEPLYKHFDKVCLIYEGKMAYFGPADQARQYFIDMGYQPANRQTTADFLVAVTDPKGRIPRDGISSQPRTALEFAQYFKKSKLAEENKADIASYMGENVGRPNRASAYIESARAEFAKGTRKQSPYLLSIPQQVRAVMLRKVQIFLGNKLAQGLQLFSFIFQGVIVGSVFLRVDSATSAFFSRGGVLFFSLLFSALTAMAEIPALYAQRPIVLRHKNAALYHPFIEALAFTLVDIPMTLAISFVFSIIIYFMVGLQSSASQFFVFLLFLIVISIAMKAWFRAIAAAFATEAAAQSFAGISILMLAIYTGYTIPKPTMIGALRWLTYINPLRYGFEAIFTNEFRTLQGTCSSLVPQGPGYENVVLANQVCTAVGSLPGQPFVDGNRFAQLSYGFSYSNTWMNLGIVIAFGIGFIAALLAFTEFNISSSVETSMILYKRSSKKSSTKGHGRDEESGLSGNNLEREPTSEKSPIDEKTPALSHATTDVFSWQHVNYTVPTHGGEDRILLNDISGFVIPGKLTALMGESGAGKTTLLNILARRYSTGVVTGDMFVNGQVPPVDFQAQTGYCQQMDTHVPTNTVREALMFSAKLRQPTSVPLAEKAAYVEKCLEMCGLQNYADAAVGTLGTEQRKRTTIGVELAAKPKLLLFLDEPTSGLDSQSAWGIMSFLRTLADQGQAILCTIHQPSAELFQVFDRILLLKKGGKTVYFGDIGKNSETLIKYFERNGARHCLPDENPAEYMLEVIGAGATAISQQDWHNIWQDSNESKQIQRDIDRIHTEGRSRPAVEAAHHTEFATSWGNQTIELIKRDAQAHWRDPTYIMAKLVLNAVGGLFIGFTFFKSKDTQAGTQNKLFAIFMATVLSVPLSNQLQGPFIAMRNVYEIRERPSRIYSWTALITSQVLVEIPWNIFGSIILFFCWYWTVGFETSRAGYTFLMLAIIFPMYYTTIAQAIAAMSPNAEIAALLFSVLFSFVIIFNGVLQPFRQLGWWRWMYRLSPYTYLVEGLLGQAIGRQTINCSPVEFVQLNPPSGSTCGQYMNAFISRAGGYLTNPEATSSCNFCSVQDSDKFLAMNFNIFYDHHWRNFGLMIAFILFNFACIFVLTYLFRIRSGPLLPSFRRRTSK